jgi:hypothetical protein
MSESTTSAERHRWLEGAVALLRPKFAAAGYQVPERIRASIGFTRGSGWQHSIGQCWAASQSTDGLHEVFVSPELGTPELTARIVGVLAHELAHATVGTAAGHKAPFKRCANAIGLTGRMTATVESPEFITWINDVVIPAIGLYPAGKIKLTYKKQTTRLIKCICGACGYPARVTRVWVENAGPPHCPAHGEMKAELVKEGV